MTIWYFTASTGLAPARICPVIIPGRLTIPTTIIALMVGISPVRMACWTIGRAASQRVAPRARSASTCWRRAVSSPPSRSRPSETPLSVLPRIIPSRGMAYCGVYHGSTRTMTVSASAAISHEPPQTEARLRSQIPG